jgi:hypothetical protein
MTDKHDPKTPQGLVTSTKLDMLKYEIFSLVSGDELTPEGVEMLARQARLRFDENMIWSIGAAGLKRIHRDARGPLASLFDEFRTRGGVLIVVVGVADGFVGSALQMCAFNAGNVPLKVVKDANEASAIVKRARADQQKT